MTKTKKPKSKDVKEHWADPLFDLYRVPRDLIKKAFKRDESTFWSITFGNKSRGFASIILLILLLSPIVFTGMWLINGPLAINTSVVNQLQQITMVTRTNDMFNPIIVDSGSGVMKVEVTFPTLNYIDENLPAETSDYSDMYIHLYRIENPIASIYDWNIRGQYLNDILLDSDENDYDFYCDRPDPTDTYWTHFYIEWDSGVTLIEGWTYALLVDFYDADDEFHWCETVWENIDFGGGVPEFDVAASINVDPDPPSEETMVGILSDCDFISFFEYQASEVTTPPTTTPPTTPPPGEEATGWFNQYDIFENINNGMALLILIAILLGLALLVIIIILLLKKKKDKK